MAFKFYLQSMLILAAADSTLSHAASTESAMASITPIRRCPTTSGLPNIRMSVPGTANASSIPEKATSVDVPSAKSARLADGP